MFSVKCVVIIVFSWLLTTLLLSGRPFLALSGMLVCQRTAVWRFRERRDTLPLALAAHGFPPLLCMRADQWPSPVSPSGGAMNSPIGCALHFFRLPDWVFPMVTASPFSAAVIKFRAANEFVLFIFFLGSFRFVSDLFIVPYVMYFRFLYA